MHGENANDTIGQFGGGGTTPDAWRELNSHTNGILTSGDISTCVEKTMIRSHPICESTGHLRVCGENWADRLPAAHLVGDISMCVEKTNIRNMIHVDSKGHLRIRGEN